MKLSRDYMIDKIVEELTQRFRWGGTSISHMLDLKTFYITTFNSPHACP